jgi:hypothetical protein
MLMNEICPVCGGPTVLKKVTEIIRGGKHTAIASIQNRDRLLHGEIDLMISDIVPKSTRINNRNILNFL